MDSALYSDNTDTTDSHTDGSLTNDESKNEDVSSSFMTCPARVSGSTSLSKMNDTPPGDARNYDCPYAHSQNIIRHVLPKDALQVIMKADFDIFEFSRHKDIAEKPLLIIGMFILQNMPPFVQLFEESCLSYETCAYFLDALGKKYRDNPYHNSLHATDVMHFVTLLIQSKFVTKHFTPMECLGLVMAAAAHDAAHNGRNNDFHKKTQSNLTKLFKDSYLERYHIQTTQEILDSPQCNFLKGLDDTEQQHIRALMNYSILGTDMGTYHQNIRAQLKQNCERYARKETLSQEDKLFIFRAILHTADISNPVRPYAVSKKWGDRVVREFYEQGDEMRDLGLEISPLCDRHEVKKKGSEAGFLQFCVLPLLHLMSEVIEELQHWIEEGKQNVLRAKEPKQ